MAFTGRLGIDDSQLGNLELGSDGTSDTDFFGAETGTGTDSADRSPEANETGTGTDDAFGGPPTVFTGRLGIDASQLGDIELGFDDSPSGSDFSDSDTGTGTESADRDPEATETGTGTEDASGPAEGFDTGAGDDLVSVLDRTGLSETGSGTDSAGPDHARTTGDSGVAADNAAMDSPTPAEAGVGTDNAHVTKFGADTASSPKTPSTPSGCGPYDGPVEILYDGLDITSCVLMDQASFRSQANGGVGTATIRVKDAGHIFGFVSGRSLELKVNGLREWAGYVGRVRNGYFFTGTLDDPGNVVRYFELSGVDYNVLFQKRILFDKVDPTKMQLTTFPANTDDDIIIKAYVADHLDLSGDGLSTTGVEHVGTPSQDAEISGAAGWTWGQLARFLRFNTGAIDYIDPDRTIIHTDVDTPDAPYELRDVPAGGSAHYRELEIEFNGGAIRNDALVWGMGQGSKTPVFRRTQDATSIADHNRWQVARVLTSVWKQATVNRASDSLVYGSPQNKRGGKDDAKAVRLVTFQQGFRVGQKASFVSAVWGYSDVLPIRTIEIDFPTQQNPRYRMVLSHEIDDPWSSIDPFKFNFDFPPISGIDIPPFDIPPFVLPPFDPCLPKETLIMFDNFERPNGPGWGTSTDGHVWDLSHLGTVTYTAASIFSGLGRIAANPGTSDGYVTAPSPGPWNASEWVLHTVFIDRNSATSFPMALQTSTGAIGFAYDGENGTLIISDLEDDLHSIYNHSLGAALVHVKMHYRLGVILEAKVWADGDDEPADYQVYGKPTAAVDPTTYFLVGAPTFSTDFVYLDVDFIEFTILGFGGLIETFSRVVDPNTVSFGLSEFGAEWESFQFNTLYPTLQPVILDVDGSQARMYMANAQDGGSLQWVEHWPDAVGVAAQLPIEVLWRGVYIKFSPNCDGIDVVLDLAAEPDPFNAIHYVFLELQPWRISEGTPGTEIYGIRVDLDSSGGASMYSIVPPFDNIKTFPEATEDEQLEVYFDVRIRVESNATLVRIWESGTTEPGTWLPGLAGDNSDLDNVLHSIGIESLGLTNRTASENRVGLDEIEVVEGGYVDPCLGPTPPPPDSGPGSSAEPGSARGAPPGYPPDDAYFNTSSPFVPDTTRVWLDGELLRLGIDYGEGDPYYGHFIHILSSIDVTGKTVYIAYEAIVGG